jgi:hypothetical protein
MNLFFPVVYAGRRKIYNEKFENVAEGSLPKGWTIKPGTKSDIASVENGFVDQGKKSLKLKETTDGSSVWVRSPNFRTYIVDDFVVSFSFRIVGDDSARAVFMLLDERGDKAIGINCRLRDNWRYSTKMSLWYDIPNLPTPEAGELYEVTIRVDTRNNWMNVGVNGVESGWIPIWKGWDYISKIGFHNNDRHPSEFWIDDVNIRLVHNKKTK